MVLTQCMDALNDITALVDKASPRTERGSGGRRCANCTDFGCNLDSDDDNDEDEDVVTDDDFNAEEVIWYLVHKITQKKQIGFISREKWARLSAECRKALRDMSPEVHEELCALLADEMRGEGGNLEANSAKTSGQDPDTETEDVTSAETPMDGCPMVQKAIKDMNKKKKAAAQSKTAGSTKRDAHSGDNRLMMSQKGKGRKDKRSGYTLQRFVSTTTRAPGATTLELSEDVFGNIEERSAGIPTPTTPTAEQAW
jgi:hypothetical protein